MISIYCVNCDDSDVMWRLRLPGDISVVFKWQLAQTQHIDACATVGVCFFFFLLPQNVASIIMIALLFYVNSYHLQIATEYL